MTLGRPLIIAVVLAVLASPGPAVAETVADRDGTRDMEEFDAKAFEAAPEPDQANGDLKGYRISYGSKRIRIRLAFRELDHSQRRLALGGAFRFRGGSTVEYDAVVVRARPGNWAGTARLTERPRCDVVRRLDYLNDRARISFPSRCIGGRGPLRFFAFASVGRNLRDGTYDFYDVAPGSALRNKWTIRISRG